MKENEISFTPHQEKVIQTDNHVALTANAGSGKTFVLKYKYLNAAKKLNGDVSKIAAITFTNKAANELYKKISELVDEEISITKDKTILKTLYKIRRGLVSAYISTIHSFCVELLKQYPVEAGVDSNFTPINKSIANELIEISIQETIDDLFKDQNDSIIIKELIRYFGSRTKLEEELKKLIENKKNVLLLKDKIYNKPDSEIEYYFNETYNFLIQEVSKIYKQDFIDSLIKINSAVLQENNNNTNALIIDNYLKDFKTNEDFILLLKNISLTAFTKSDTIRLQGYLSKPLKEKYSSEIYQLENTYRKLKSLIENNLALDLHKELVTFGKKILFIFDKVYSLYESKKRKNSYIDFDDILIKTKLLLKNDTIRKELSSKFDYLMVDEYQDTDEIQYEIFLPILDDLNSGNLFIVGDDKQSIYRFRDADLNVFEKTKKDIENQNKESGLQLLPDSFRMVKELCLFINYIFNRLFKSSIPLFNELKNAPIICANESKENAEIEFLHTIKEQSDNLSLAELTALKILDNVKNSKYTFSNIAVLVTKRKHFDELEKIFTLKDIPYKIIGGRGFYQRQVVSDIRNYLSFISNTNDDISLIAILRSPFFMLSDIEIVKIDFCNGSNFFEKLKNYHQNTGKYSEIIQILDKHIKLCSSLPTSILIKKILSETDFLTIIKSRHNGEQELANIEKILNIAREYDTQGFKTLYDFVNYLDDARLNNPDEAQAEGLLSDYGVQLMTIHQAKGLEFPIVYLYRCEDAPELHLSKAKEIIVNKDIGLLFKVKSKDDPFEDYQLPPIVAINDFIERGKELAEIKRLLYVGITRAINKLFITYESKDNDSYDSRSFISLLNEVLPNANDDIILIEDDLTFLLKDNEKYFNKTEKLQTIVRVKDKSSFEQTEIIKQKTHESDKKYLINTITLKDENEFKVISATKISVFEKCPLKYHLTYNIGLAKLLKLLSKEITIKSKKQIIDYSTEANYKSNEDEILINEDKVFEKYNSDKYGQIVHKILEKNIQLDKVPEFLLTQTFIDAKEFQKEENRNKVINLLENYYCSDVYKELLRYNNYKNEFEIIIKEENVILKGIVDKIIFHNNSIIIVDFKTDFVDPTNIEEHYAMYQIQMKFYLYISMKIFENYTDFSSRIIFLRNPNFNFELNYKRGNISTLRKEIFELVKGILDKKTYKNLNHCDKCIFSITNNNCIIN